MSSFGRIQRLENQELTGLGLGYTILSGTYFWRISRKEKRRNLREANLFFVITILDNEFKIDFGNEVHTGGGNVITSFFRTPESCICFFEYRAMKWLSKTQTLILTKTMRTLLLLALHISFSPAEKARIRIQ